MDHDSATLTPMTTLAVKAPAWTLGVYGQLDMAKPIADMLSKSEMVPKAFQGKPMDILIAGAMGARLGLDLFSSLAGIAVVNGRATLWGDALLAVCQQHPEFEDYAQEVTGDGEQMAASVTVKRKHRSAVTETFTMADAKRAGLAGKQGPWTQYPKRMLTLRARAFALRACFADALAGFHAREELDDEEVREVKATVHAEPKPARQRAAPAAVDAVAPAPAAGVDPVKMEPEQPAAKALPTVERCVERFAALWKSGETGLAAAKQLRVDWKLGQITELAGATDDDRQAFLDQAEAALVKAGGAA